MQVVTNSATRPVRPIRVMLADDHPIVMTGFAMSLAGVGMDVICLIFAAYVVVGTGLIWGALRGVTARRAAA